MISITSTKEKPLVPKQLLRRPRAPQVLPPLANKASPQSNKDYSDGAAVRLFQNSFELDVFQDVVDREAAETGISSPHLTSELNEVKFSGQNERPVVINVLNTSPGNDATFVSRDYMKYVLDPHYKEETSLGTFATGKKLIKPFKPRGPDPLPPRVPRKCPEIIMTNNYDDQRFCQPPAFMLEHFVYKLAENKNISVPRVKNVVFSRHNVKKLTDLLAYELTHEGQESVHTITFDSSDIPVKKNRIPQWQLLCEMAALIKQHMKQVMGTSMKSVIKPMPKYSPAYSGGSQLRMEIVLYEDDTLEKMNASIKTRRETELPGTDAVLQSARSRYFQGSGRNRSPLTVHEDAAILPSELTVLDSLITGGTVLSFKAHFIAELPDLTPFGKTLTYLNLCFNNFVSFPLEVLDLSSLEVLKMRNNPMVEIPADITRLQNLRVFIASFCLITALPLSLFDLPCLEDLSVAYNRLTFIPTEICKLKSLSVLDIEGNQIPSLPASCLKMEKLSQANVCNNFMHPVFWKEHTSNKPQPLLDLACVSMYKADLHKNPQLLSPEAIKTLSRVEECDCCKGPLFGSGLRTIRPVPKLFSVKNMPLMFRACTPECLNYFKSMSPEALRILLYGE